MDADSSTATGPTPPVLAPTDEVAEDSSPKRLGSRVNVTFVVVCVIVAAGILVLVVTLKALGSGNDTTTCVVSVGSATTVELFGNTYDVATTTSVTQIGFNLTDSSIPTEIGLLECLTHVNLPNGRLMGTIPSEIGVLTKLTYLWLSGTELSGTIPSEVGLLTKLTGFGADIGGTLPSELGLLTQLRWLVFVHYHNEPTDRLVGTIPSELGRLSKLAELSLRSNGLTGSVPTEFGLLMRLASLDLSDNLLSESMPSEMGLMTQLTHLSISNNTVSGNIPSEFGMLKPLASLRLFMNRLSGMIPSELGQLTQLTDLSLADNRLSGSIPGFLCSEVTSIWVDCPPDPFPVECSCSALWFERECGCA